MSDYIAVKQHVTMEFTCLMCMLRLLVNPNEPNEVCQIEPWLKVQDSTGASIGVCSTDCLQKYAATRGQKIEIVNG